MVIDPLAQLIRALEREGRLPQHWQAPDEDLRAGTEEAYTLTRRLAMEEGLLVGISSGATLAAIAQKLPELPSGATVLGFNYDTGERYLSIEGFLPAE